MLDPATVFDGSAPLEACVPRTAGNSHRPNAWQTAAMPSKPESWTIEHFSQANPVGPGQDSVPALLRRIADSIEQRPCIEVQDVILHNEVNADGDWWSATVYFHEPSV